MADTTYIRKIDAKDKPHPFSEPVTPALVIADEQSFQHPLPKLPAAQAEILFPYVKP